MWVRELLLAAAVCIDFLFVAMSYGAGRIRVPASSAMILSAVGAAALWISLCFSAQLCSLLAPSVCTLIGSCVLCGIGIINLFQTAIKTCLRRAHGDKRLSFSCGQLNFVLEVFLDESLADRDASKSISVREAFWLAVAFSLDSLSCGLAAGLQGISANRSALFSFGFGLLAIFAGVRIGARLGACKHDCSLISGLCLLALGGISLLQ